MRPYIVVEQAYRIDRSQTIVPLDMCVADRALYALIYNVARGVVYGSVRKEGLVAVLHFHDNMLSLVG